MNNTFCPHIWGGDVKVAANKPTEILVEITENNSNHGPTNYSGFFLSVAQAEQLRDSLTKALNDLTEALETQIIGFSEKLEKETK